MDLRDRVGRRDQHQVQVAFTDALELEATGIGGVTPDGEHEGRGPAIRRARRVGLMLARRQRIAYHRLQRHQHQPPERR